jgi:hypothetical protein
MMWAAFLCKPPAAPLAELVRRHTCWILRAVAVTGVVAVVPQDFYSKECWAHHPLPYADFVDFKRQERAELEAERKKLVQA